MKRWCLAVALTVAASLGMGLLHPFGNPRVVPSKGLGTLLQGGTIPAGARAVLIGKCADCHSDETRWPVYARLAPGSWLIERDIMRARGKMNLSRWEEMRPEEKEVLVAKMIHETKTGEMPPVQYRALHWRARVTAEDVMAVRGMSGDGRGAVGLGSSAGDAARGKAVFEKRCTGCHAMNGEREGPHLAGVFGRKAGSVAGFDYSAGLRSSGLTWNDVTLDRWLTDPDLVAADSKMDFHVPKAQERADLIAYFKRQ